MSDLRIVALDPSLTATGVADESGARTLKVPLPTKATDLQRVQRLHKLTCAIDVATKTADVVVIEGYGYGSVRTRDDGGRPQNTSHAHSLGELGGVIKCCLYQRDVDFVIVPPTVMKVFATGRGNASKEDVLIAAVKRSVNVRNNNEADAWWLRQMACVYYGHSDRIVVPTRNEKALLSVKWPQLEQEGVAVG